MKQNIDQIEQIVDKEIDLYQKMEKCLSDKKQVIIKGEVELLKDLDTQLIEYTTYAANLAKLRQDENISLGKANLTFKEVVEKAKEYDNEQSQRLFDKKTKLEKIVKKIQTVNKVNEKLIKNSLLIMEKTMNIILSTVVPESNFYNKSGKINKLNENYKMSSVSTEA